MSEVEVLNEISAKLDSIQASIDEISTSVLTILGWQEYIVGAIIMVGGIYLAYFILKSVGLWGEDAQ